MDELTLLRDAHHVDPPNSDLIERDRASIAALIDAPTTARTPAQERARRGRRARRPILAGTLAVGVLGGVGAVAASGLLDDNTRELVNSIDCNITTDDARLVATATDTRGDTIELWTLDAENGFGNLIVEKRPDGTWNGASMGCDAEPRSSALAAGQPYAVAPNLTDNQATLIRLYGWVPQPASTAVVALSDGTNVTAAVDSDGYFLQPVTVAPNAGIDVTHIQAVNPDGAVVAERDLP